MKKLFLSVLLCLMTFSMNAQRCAVLEFKAGVGISQADVDGILAIFITYFRPAGYTMVERTQIDKAIDEQGFQRSNMTESQMVRIGEILNVSKIVVGDVNVVMGQYNVDVRAINVESGTIAATEGATFAGTSYRTTMQSIAQKLAGKIAITPGSTVQSAPTQPSQSGKRSGVEVIYGYLKIFPNELGVFESEPSSVIAQINKQVQYGYNNWRIPTNEELSLLRANGYLNGDNYMCSEIHKGKVLLVSDGEDYITMQNAWVDLGLPSGTMWKNNNEEGDGFSFDEAINQFGNSVPSKAQWQELIDFCTWTWVRNGYRIDGPNGNSITLPKSTDGIGSYYWSSTKNEYSSKDAYSLEITSNNFCISPLCSRICILLVRLVKH